MLSENGGLRSDESSRINQQECCMAQCVVCGKRALYFEWAIMGMACVEHAEDGTQVGTVRSLAAALLKSLASDGVLDPGRYPETALIAERLRPFLKD